MAQGKGNGSGRPKAEPAKSELLAILQTTRDRTRERSKSVTALAQQYGVSTDTIYRRLNSSSISSESSQPKQSSRQEPDPTPCASPETITICGSNQQRTLDEALNAPEVSTLAEPDALKEAAIEETEDPDSTNLLFEEDYTYNAESDTYITFLKSAPKPVIIPGAKHRAMLQAYSNWDGQPASINVICRTFDFPRNWFIEYKRAHGWTHDLEPATKEEVMVKPIDELVEQSFQMKRQALYRKFAKREWSETQAAADKWWDFEQSVLIPLNEHIANHAPNYRPSLLPLRESTNPFAVVFAAFDIHYAKAAWRDETGDSYDREECRQLLLHHTSALASQVAKYGRPEQLIVPIGSDWFHVDNPWGETVNGTRQDMDGSYAQMLMEGCDLAVEYIDFMRQIAPVTLIYVDGNHDRASSLSMSLYLRGWYRNSPDVTCMIQPSPRKYAEYGTTLMGFCHGDDVKLGQLPTLMAHESREAWGRAQNRVFYTGHLHHEVVRDIDGVTVNVLPSLSGADRWHTRKGFCLSKRALTAYILDKQEGPIATFTSPVQKDIPYGFKMPGNSYTMAAA